MQFTPDVRRNHLDQVGLTFSSRVWRSQLLSLLSLSAGALAFEGAALRAGSAINPAAARTAAVPAVSQALPVIRRASNIQAVASLAPSVYFGTSEDLEDRMWEYVKARGGTKLIRRILIANNGMAATKTIMSIRNWCYKTFGDERAIQFVVMATPEDLAANAEFIRRADEFIEVPGGSNANNYANVQLIVDSCIARALATSPLPIHACAASRVVASRRVPPTPPCGAMRDAPHLVASAAALAAPRVRPQRTWMRSWWAGATRQRTRSSVTCSRSATRSSAVTSPSSAPPRT